MLIEGQTYIRLFCMSMMNPAGGLRYHLKARRYRQNLWQDFINDLNLGLNTWQPQSKKLLLIGPSAGYSLTDSFLSRFEQIDAIEPDPVAPFIFRRIHPGIKVNWHKGDYFAPQKNHFKIRKFDELLSKFPDSAILFCNFLGQLAVLYKFSPLSFQVFKVDITKRLNDREWASYHDRMSGAHGPTISPEEENFVDEKSLGEIAESFYHLDADGATEFVDHETEGLFAGRQRKYMNWSLTPDEFHLIELTHHQALLKDKPKPAMPTNLEDWRE